MRRRRFWIFFRFRFRGFAFIAARSLAILFACEFIPLNTIIFIPFDTIIVITANRDDFCQIFFPNVSSSSQSFLQSSPSKLCWTQQEFHFGRGLREILHQISVSVGLSYCWMGWIPLLYIVDSVC